MNDPTFLQDGIIQSTIFVMKPSILLIVVFLRVFSDTIIITCSNYGESRQKLIDDTG